MKKVFAVGSSFILPAIALAQDAGSVLQTVSNIFGYLVPILISLAVLWFFWGLVEYLRGGGEDKEKGKQTMIYGIIALFVMVSVWGLVGLIGNTFGIQQGGGAIIPNIPRI